MNCLRDLAFLLVVLLSAVGTGYSQTKNDRTKPELYILSLGVAHYQHYGSRNPYFAAKDARDLASTLQQTARKQFARVHTTLLVNGQATRSGIAAAVKQIILKARAQDTFVFFYSGHGKTIDENNGKEELFYLLPSDYDASRDKVETKGISAAQLQYWFIQIECEHQFVALDSSKSSGGFQDFKDNIDLENKRLAGLASRDIVIVSVKSVSFEFAALHNGLLTYVLVHGLRGLAARPTGDVSALGLISYVDSQLPRVLKKNANAKARAIIKEFPDSGKPFVYSSGEDFVLGGARAIGRPSDGFAVSRLPSSDDQGVLQPVSFVRTGSGEPTGKCEYTKLPSTSNSDRKGKDFALLIAIDNYDHWDRLTNPIFDAETLARTLHDRYDFETEVLKNPDNDCIDDAVNRYARMEYEPDSQLFVFFAGHGIYLDNVKTGFIIAKDSRSLDDDIFGRSFTSHGLFRRMVGSIKCKHILLVMDACQSGTIDEGASPQDTESESACDDGNLPEGNTEEDFAARLLACKTRQFVTSGDKEYVPDGEPGKHSPFASQFLQALTKDSGGQRFVSLNNIYPVIQRVPKILPPPWVLGRRPRTQRFSFFPALTANIRSLRAF